jgi:glycosyltransferase involved in cell wall biosynthesis
MRELGRTAVRCVAPPVSIGLPVLDGERFLAEAIESILDQDFVDFELVISDNGSSDGTEKIGRRYATLDRRVAYVRHSRNRGLAWNFNYVLARTSGTLFKWAAWDDLLCPTWLSRCVDALDASPAAVLAYTRRVKIDADGEPLAPNGTPRGRKDFLRDCAPGARFTDFLARTTSCVEAFGVIRRGALQRTRRLLSFPAADRVLLAELILLGPFVEVPDELFLDREHEGRASRRPWTPTTGSVWTDPRRPPRVVFPTWRQGIELARAIERSAVSGRERRDAYAGLAAWARRRSLVLADNILDAARARNGGATMS